MQYFKEDMETQTLQESYMSNLINTIQCSKTTFEDTNSESEDDNVVRRPVRVLLVKSPDLLYLATNEESTQKVQRDLHIALQLFYSKQPKETKNWFPKDKCVAYDKETKEYFRGMIIEKFDGKLYQIMLRDIAKEIVVSTAELYALREQFTRFREGAVRCHLANITPAGDKSKWSAISVEFLKEVFEKQSRTYISTKGPIDLKRKSMPVVMWYAETKSGGALEPSRTILHNINKLLVKNGLAFNIQRCVKKMKLVCLLYIHI